MKPHLDFRPVLAASTLLVLLAGTYQVARHLPGPAVAPQAPAVAASPAPPAASARPFTPPPEPAPAEPAPCPPGREQFASSPASWRPWRVRRYVGTVGGRPATAVLEWQNPDSLEGRFYLHRGGPAYTLYDCVARPGRGTQLGVAPDYPRDAAPDGRWHLPPGPPGPVLTGTWHPAHGRPLRLLLRESYAGALHYTFQQLLLLGGYRVPGACYYVPETSHRLLALPAPRTAPPALGSRLAGSPAALRRRLRADAATRDGDATASYYDEVRLNDFQLFSYQTSFSARAYGGTPDEGVRSWLFDLRSGRQLSLASQLRPGYELPLRRLISQHLLHDAAFGPNTYSREESLRPWNERHDRGEPSNLVPLPAPPLEALTLTPDGLEAAYSSSMLSRASPVVLLPYPELRPLVRPGTPLAGMLRARGLW